MRSLVSEIKKLRHCGVIWVLVCVLVSTSAGAGEFQAGVAKSDVTPPSGGSMYGYAMRGENVSTGVHDPLYAKAIVCSDGDQRFAMVTLDLGSLPAENTARIRGAVVNQLGFDNVLLVASHTHSAPSFSPDFPTAEEPYVRAMEEKIVAAIVAAHDKLQPARIGVGWGQAAEGHNRRLVQADGRVKMLWENRERTPTHPVDHSVGVIAVDTIEGQPLATLVNFACHPVVLGPENLQLSADYPGAMMAYLEDRIGGQAMFVQGAAGDINPYWDKTPPDDGAFEQVRKMGETIGREAERVRQSISDWNSGELQIQTARQTFPLEMLLGRRQNTEEHGSWSHSAILCGGVSEGTQCRSQHDSDWRRHRAGHVSWRILCGARSAAEVVQLIPHTFFVGYTNGALGYFPTIRAAAEGGYGATIATVVEVGTGEMLVNDALIRLHQLAGKLHSQPGDPD